MELIPGSPKSKKDRWLFGLILVWVGLVFHHFFTWDSFFDFSFLPQAFSHFNSIDANKWVANWAGFLKTLFSAFAACFTLWRWGKKLFKGLNFHEDNGPLRFCQETACGILFLNGLWLSLGLNGLWYEALILPLAVVLFGWALWDFKKGFLNFQKFPALEGPGGGWKRVLAFGVFFFLGLSLVQVFSPEVYYDALVYHLSTLRFWQFHHGITNLYTNLYSYFPFGAELYFMNAFIFRGGEAAKALNGFSAILCAMAAAGWAAEEAGVLYGWMVWGMVLCFPLISTTVWADQNDVFFAFFLILFFNALSRWGKEKGSLAVGVKAGLWGGAALTVKYTAGLEIAMGFLALAFTQPKVMSRKFQVGGIAALGLMIFLAAPWLLKNWFYTGNGYYPYFSSWLGGLALPLEQIKQLMEDHDSPLITSGSLGNWARRVLTRDLDITIGPLLFSFFPFFFLRSKKNPATRFLWVLAVFLLLSGFGISHQPRLMIPAFVVCFILMGLILAGIEKKPWVTSLWVWVVLIFGFWGFLSLARISVQYYGNEKLLVGAETETEYLENSTQTKSYFDLTRAVEGLPPSDRLLIAGDARGLYYPRLAFNNSVFDEQVLAKLAKRENNGNGIRLALRKMGVDDVVVSGKEGLRVAPQYGHYQLSPEEWDRLEDFIQHHTDLVYLSGTNGVYRLLPAPIERKKRLINLLLLFRTSS